MSYYVHIKQEALFKNWLPQFDNQDQLGYKHESKLRPV